MANQETKFNKSSFIRARPNMEVQEIIKEAEKVGQVISPGAIWTLRSSDKRKGKSKKGKKTSSGKVTTHTSAKKQNSVQTPKVKPFNKSDFIRKYKKLTAQEIINKARELGHSITPGMVYTLRSADRKEGGSPIKASKKVKITKEASTPLIGRSPSISFDPSDPVARKFIAAGLAGTA